MDISLWFKVPAIISAFILTSKFLLDLASGKSAKLKDDYRFSKEFLTDVESGILHQYSIEKGYQAIAGTDDVSMKEVEYILTLENSSKCLKDYILAKDYLQKIEPNGALKLQFKLKFSSNYSRLWRKGLFGFMYFVLSFIAFSPLFFDMFLGITKLQSFIILMVTIPTFGFPAWLSLKVYARIKRGEQLVENQSKYTTSIIVKT